MNFLNITVALSILFAAYPAHAASGSAQEAEGKEASIALLEQFIQGHSGRFCGAKQNDVEARVDEDGNVVITYTNERIVPGARVLAVARALPENERIMVGYCKGRGKRRVVDVVGLVHAVREGEPYWYARLLEGR
jgi:hypothetical protein